MKSRPLYAAACIALLFVAGCSQVPQSAQSGQSGAVNSGPALPDLNPVDDIRDQVARAEYAISDASGQMAELATDCADCRTGLEQVQADASSRLSLSGGMWNPWPTASEDALKNLPEPGPTGDAPHTPVGLVGYMMQTASDQLAALAAVPDMPAEDSQVLASILAGRMVAAHNIASVYGINPADAGALLPEGATWTTVGVPVAQSSLPTGEAEAIQSGAQSADSADSAQSVWQTDAAAAEALISYDCVGTTLGFTELTTSALATEESINLSLLDRVTALTELGVPDGRGVRCVLQDHSADGALKSLLAADLAFMTSTSPEIRTVAANYLLQDLNLWLTLGTPDSVSPGLTVAAGTTSTGVEPSREPSEEPSGEQSGQSS